MHTYGVQMCACACMCTRICAHCPSRVCFAVLCRTRSATMLHDTSAVCDVLLSRRILSQRGGVGRIMCVHTTSGHTIRKTCGTGTKFSRVHSAATAIQRKTLPAHSRHLWRPPKGPRRKGNESRKTLLQIASIAQQQCSQKQDSQIHFGMKGISVASLAYVTC